MLGYFCVHFNFNQPQLHMAVTSKQPYLVCSIYFYQLLRFASFLQYKKRFFEDFETLSSGYALLTYKHKQAVAEMGQAQRVLKVVVLNL